MQKITNKQMAYAIWILSVLSCAVSFLLFSGQALFFGNIIALAFQILLGYTIYRDKNDKFTAISVIAIAIFTFNLAGLVAIILRLIIRKNNSEKIRNMWYLPAVISVFFSLIRGLSAIGIIYLIFDALYYLIFGYWFLKYLEL